MAGRVSFMISCQDPISMVPGATEYRSRRQWGRFLLVAAEERASVTVVKAPASEGRRYKVPLLSRCHLLLRIRRGSRKRKKSSESEDRQALAFGEADVSASVVPFWSTTMCNGCVGQSFGSIT